MRKFLASGMFYPFFLSLTFLYIGIDGMRSDAKGSFDIAGFGALFFVLCIVHLLFDVGVLKTSWVTFRGRSMLDKLWVGAFFIGIGTVIFVRRYFVADESVTVENVLVIVAAGSILSGLGVIFFGADDEPS